MSAPVKRPGYLDALLIVEAGERAVLDGKTLHVHLRTREDLSEEEKSALLNQRGRAVIDELHWLRAAWDKMLG